MITYKWILTAPFTLVFGSTLALIINTLAIADVSPGGRGVLFGANHAFSVTAPQGWVLDNQSGAAQGIHMAFYPEGYTWSNSPVIVYGNTSTGNAEQQVAKTVREFHANNNPNYHSKTGTPITLQNNKKAPVYFFEGDQWGNYEAGVYFSEDETLNFLIYSARDSESFRKYWTPFLSLAQSYNNVFRQLHSVTRAEFESMSTEAKEISSSKEGEKYESEDMKSIGPYLAKIINECADFHQGKALLNFKLLAHVMPDGSTSSIDISPRSSLSVCFASSLLNAKHLEHSFEPDYPLVINMKMQQEITIRK